VLLVEKALERPLVGWGTWGRWRIRDEMGRDITVSDSLWIISFGRTGVVGLVSMMTVLLLPTLLFARRIPPRYWFTPMCGAAAALAVLLVLYMYDGMLNAMLNPLYVLAAGGLSGFYVCAPGQARAMTMMRAQRVVQTFAALDAAGRVPAMPGADVQRMGRTSDA